MVFVPVFYAACWCALQTRWQGLLCIQLPVGILLWYSQHRVRWWKRNICLSHFTYRSITKIFLVEFLIHIQLLFFFLHVFYFHGLLFWMFCLFWRVTSCHYILFHCMWFIFSHWHIDLFEVDTKQSVLATLSAMVVPKRIADHSFGHECKTISTIFLLSLAL